MMTQEVMELVRCMGGEDWEEGLVYKMAGVAQNQICQRLRTGLTPEDCGGAFSIAAAWLVLAALREGDAQAGVESFSAGDLTIRTGGSGTARQLEQQAWKLLAPYCNQPGFAVQGVPG